MIDRLVALAILAIVLGVPIGVAVSLTGQALVNFVFLYPLLMSLLWTSGSLYFWWHWERHWHWRHDRPQPQPAIAGDPIVSILIPCFNEGDNAAETIAAALSQRYAHVEVIAINDGSGDNTAQILDTIAAVEPRLRVLHLAKNQGKAVALSMGALSARSEYLVCIDGDALLDKDAAAFLVKALVDNPTVGAVTGNPRIRTRSTLIGRVQVGEFSSIIGMIKRTQRVYGRVFTVSGVVTAFRRSALHDVGYWSPDMITEDIDITWKLQLNNWKVFYEPRALCWILMPETLRGLWKQRLRWAQGGAEVLLKNFTGVWNWRHRYMWPLLLESTLSAGWAFTFALLVLLALLGQFFGIPAHLQVTGVLQPGFTGLVLACMCLVQFAVSLFIERRYEAKLAGSLFWVIWYPLAFWVVTMLTTVVSFPKVMLKTRRDRARWTSPDRGIKRSN